MALDALWAVLIPEVSGVSEVQAPVYAGFIDTPAVLPEVSEVSGRTGSRAGDPANGGIDTPDTPPENLRYQREPAWALGCTLDTPDTCKTIDTEANAANELLSGELLTDIQQNSVESSEPKRLFRQRGPWLTDTEQTAAKAYHLHHSHCHQCIAAGRGARYGGRCAVGLALWTDYTGANDLQTEGA